MTVADRIKNKRIELGLSQTELAERAKYSDKTAISKIEHSGNEITMKQVRRIAGALGVTTEYLMGWQKQVEQATGKLEPYMKQLAEQTEQLKEVLSYDLDLQQGLMKEIESLMQNYEPSEVVRAIQFIEAFLKSDTERQKIALEILRPNQVDS